ncbi:MAG: glycosyltransferase [Bacteroidales bacterium]|nr:glycosyltransferase [Bacteroidales bacterium]
MQKILVFTDAFSGGGAEEVMGSFCSVLKSKYKVLHVAKWKGPKNYPIPYWKISLNKKSLKKCIPYVIWIIVRYKPDIIFTSTGHNNLLFLILKMFYFRKLKVIIRESSVASVMNSFTLKSRLINKLLVKPIYKRADCIIVQSNDMSNDLKVKYEIANRKIVTINNPILLKNTALLSTPQSKDENSIRIVHIGRFSVEKGHSRLIQIFKQLPEKYTLSLIGDGKLMDNIKILAKGLKIDDRIEFLGFLQEEKKLEVILKSHLVIQTSYVEGFPNSLLECLACGIPAIAFNVPGGTREIINEKNGILVEDNNIAEMVDRIINTNWSNYNKEEIIEDVSMRFGIEKISSKLLKVFHEI